MAFAFFFSDVGVGEWFVLLAVVLVVVGPKRLPEVARTVGRWYSRICRAAESFKRQLMEMDAEMDGAAAEIERQATNAFTVESAPAPQQNTGLEGAGVADKES